MKKIKIYKYTIIFNTLKLQFQIHIFLKEIYFNYKEKNINRKKCIKIFK